MSFCENAVSSCPSQIVFDSWLSIRDVKYLRQKYGLGEQFGAIWGNLGQVGVSERQIYAVTMSLALNSLVERHWLRLKRWARLRMGKRSLTPKPPIVKVLVRRLVLAIGGLSGLNGLSRISKLTKIVQQNTGRNAACCVSGLLKSN